MRYEFPDSEVICVDLDQTLVRTDTVQESIIRAFKRHPLLTLVAFLLLFRGRPLFKKKIFSLAHLNVSRLPFNQELIEYLKSARLVGKKIVLATASLQEVADQVAAHLGIFDVVLGTTTTFNLKGANKGRVLADRFGPGRFAYAGDAFVDLAVWKLGGESLVVSSNQRLIDEAGKVSRVVAVFPELGCSAANDAQFKHSKCLGGPFAVIGYNGGYLKYKFRSIVRALRVHQWVKNLLVFVPAIAGHRLFDPGLLTPLLALDVFLVWVLFSTCASSVYLLNDLFDLDADRAHQRKRMRPFASGDLQLITGLGLVPLLLGITFFGALFFPAGLALVIAVYWVTTLFYSMALKAIAIVDLIVLASLYTLRVFAGSAATGIALSPWLLAFSLFIFFSLACVKRIAELKALLRARKQDVVGRGYRASDLAAFGQFSVASGFIALLVFVLYVNEPAVRSLYSNPELLWFLCPVLLFWISRVILLAQRGLLNEDPVVFALRDKASYIAALVSAIIAMLAL